MKNPVAYYLLLFYTVTICQPIIPWVQDVIAHTFYEYEHIATVHHQNGKNHVHFELGKLASSNNSNQTVDGKSYSNVPLHTPVACEIVFNNQPIIAPLIFYDLINRLPQIFKGISVPPPRA